jgi:hypothetical protein
MTIFYRDDVRALLPTVAFSDEQLESTMYMVAGWLRLASRLTVLPDPLPLDHPLYGPALELVVMALTNPEGLLVKGFGPGTRRWPLEDRKASILEEIRKYYLRLGTMPSGSFPDPVPLPDPQYAALQLVRWTGR